MKRKNLSAYLLTALLALPLLRASAGAATIDVVETFDYPGSTATRPQKINDHGVQAGIFLDPTTGASEGFYRSRGGTFGDPIVEPNDTTAFTEVRGINNQRTICGDYTGSDGLFHGFFLSHGVFTEFDISSSFTIVLGINNVGDSSGSFIDDSSGVQEGYVDLGGTVTGFSVPGSTATLAYQVNDSDQATGYYIDADGITHGYQRASDGTLTFPIDPAGSTGTILFGSNDSNWAVGRYSDSTGFTHGLFFTTPGNFTTFDFPGSTFTSLNGINAQGFICGRYMDASGAEHGFLAKVNVNATDNALNSTNARPAAPVDKVHRSVPAALFHVPAS
ncbi:MAG TPA: hypothetical protein VGF73_07965 [Chthoniobacterales bacterium]|jgi:hypothetical protein